MCMCVWQHIDSYGDRNIVFSLSLLSFPLSLSLSSSSSLNRMNTRMMFANSKSSASETRLTFIASMAKPSGPNPWLHLYEAKRSLCNSTRSKVDKLMLWCYLDSHHISIGKSMHTHSLTLSHASMLKMMSYFLCVTFRIVHFLTILLTWKRERMEIKRRRRRKNAVEKTAKQSQKDTLVRIVCATHIMIFPLHSSLNAIPHAFAATATASAAIIIIIAVSVFSLSFPFSIGFTSVLLFDMLKH